MTAIEEAKRLLREAVNIADDLLTQLKVLGETKEERSLTLAAFEGLTPAQLRKYVIEGKQKEALLKHLSREDADPTKPDRSVQHTLLEKPKEAQP